MPGQMVGKSDHLHAVHVTDPTGRVGELRRVRITGVTSNSLAGELPLAAPSLLRCPNPATTLCHEWRVNEQAVSRGPSDRAEMSCHCAAFRLTLSGSLLSARQNRAQCARTWSSRGWRRRSPGIVIMSDMNSADPVFGGGDLRLPPLRPRACADGSAPEPSRSGRASSNGASGSLDGCQHWWADGGTEGDMVPRRDRKTGKPVCLKPQLPDRKHRTALFATASATLTAGRRRRAEAFFRQVGAFSYIDRRRTPTAAGSDALQSDACPKRALRASDEWQVVSARR